MPEFEFGLTKVYLTGIRFNLGLLRFRIEKTDQTEQIKWNKCETNVSGKTSDVLCNQGKQSMREMSVKISCHFVPFLMFVNAFLITHTHVINQRSIKLKEDIQKLLDKIRSIVYKIFQCIFFCHVHYFIKILKRHFGGSVWRNTNYEKIYQQE